ncbi:hypothetical protein, partial [Pseudomonas sp. GP01-A4]|uniref:hypothetical protein n=1 Tax=Pseudomonas sp. GP01-A4 TaxID=2070571 RepID=UPI001C47C18F
MTGPPPAPGKDNELEIACDTIVLALGLTPATELLDAAGTLPGETIHLIGDAAAVTRPDPAYL